MKITDTIEMVLKTKSPSLILSIAPNQTVYEAIQMLARHDVGAMMVKSFCVEQVNLQQNAEPFTAVTERFFGGLPSGCSERGAASNFPFGHPNRGVRKCSLQSSIPRSGSNAASNHRLAPLHASI
jgi:hypothetical protein